MRTRRGIVLLALLIGLALLGIGLMAAVDVWSLSRQREREGELLFVGDQYRQAIRRYYYAAPAGTPRRLPGSLELLLEDDRYSVPVRHLRRLYRDPISGGPEWGVLRDGENISGVYSLSEAVPIKQTGFPAAYQQFEGQSRYRDWVFAFVVPHRGLAPASPVNPASSPPRTVPLPNRQQHP